MNSYSQNKEDVFVLSLFDKPGIFLELGAGDGTHFSNCRLLRENEWYGLSVDIDNKGNGEVFKCDVNIDTIKLILSNSTIKKRGSEIIENLFENGIDFLSIDLDGNDYWILHEIFKHVYPKCICLEVNSQLPKDKSLVINYDANRMWDGSYAYGMSYKAAFDLLNWHGYQVIRNCNNTNLIAVKDLVTLKDCSQTWSHPEEMPEGSSFKEIVFSKRLQNFTTK